MVRYAFIPLATPFYLETPDWMESEFYQLEAIAPAGTPNEAARAMLRIVLAERLGLKYKFVEKEKPTLTLLRGSGAPKLTAAAVAKPDPGPGNFATFKRKSALMEDFASFLGSLAGVSVIDKTGIIGNYQFDEDWHTEMGRPEANPAIAVAIAKKFGLKMQTGKEMRKILVVERANQEPTPN